MKKQKIKLIKPILIILSLIITIICSIKVVSNAYVYGSIEELINSSDKFGGINIAEGLLHSSPYLYCVQHGHNMSKKAVQYNVQYYIKIGGEKGAKYGYCSDGDRENESDDNARLAYILAAENLPKGYGSGYEKNTKRQEQLWGFWTRWLNYSGNKELGISGYAWDGNGNADYDLMNRANEYVNRISQNQSVSISSDVGDTIKSDNKKIGPIRVSYKGRIASITIKDVNGNDVSNSVTIEKNGRAVSANQIGSGEEFYIINNSENILKEIKVNAFNSYTQYKAEIWLLNGNKDTQRLMIVNPSSDEVMTPGSVTINLLVEEQPNPNILRVVKYGVNGETPVKQNNVKFIIYKDNSGYLCSRNADSGKMNYNNSDFYWTQDKNSATIFKTTTTDDGWDGYFQITGVPSGNYHVAEVYNPNSGYENSKIVQCNLEVWNGENKVSGNIIGDVKSGTNVNGYESALQVVSLVMRDGYTKILRIYDKQPEVQSTVFNINLKKVKLGTLSEVSGAKFKIRVKGQGWLAVNGNKYDYNATYRQAKEWTSSDSGSIFISKLDPNYRYEIFETYSPYTLSKQPGHATVKIDDNTRKLTQEDYYTVDGSGSNKVLYCGTVSYSRSGSTVMVQVTNYATPRSNPDPDPKPNKKYLYLEGIIWIDKNENVKGDKNNNLYDEGKESLYKENVKITLFNSSGKEVATTTTKSGSYSLKTNITIDSSISSKLSGYYLKFEYSDKYDVVLPNFDKENGSKALVQGEKRGVAYIYNLSKYISNFYESPTLKHMNLGLTEIKQNVYNGLTQNISYVKVVMNGYTYTYKYRDSKLEDTKDASPTIKWQGRDGYTRALYPSDIAYSVKNNWDDNSLKVYVVYKIQVKNNTLSNYGMKKSDTKAPVSYVEVDLRMTELYEEFDSSRYELETKYDSDSNKDFKDWSNDKDGIARYKGSKLNKGISAGKNDNYEDIMVQFKVKNSALADLLGTKESYEKKTTVANAQVYHNYWEAHYEWVGTGDNRYQELKFNDRKTDSQRLSAEAYYLKLDISTERTITGTVFEDTNTSNTGEVIGDGMYGNSTDGKKENTIKDVKVELISEDGNIAMLYSKENNYADKPANIASKVDGTYSFVGVTPGRYYVRFTYGDGNQVICAIDGEQYKETGNKVSLEDYKSTIVTNPYAAVALGKEMNGYSKTDRWYMQGKEEKYLYYSVAIDDLNQRAQYNNDSSSINKIQAFTALMDVGLERTTSNSVNITKSDNGVKENFLGINFGIISIPKVSIAFDKVINNVQITNAQGNVIADGNPATQNIKTVSDLDKKEHLVKGSTYIKSEINEQELYGSTMKLSYAITVQNNSQVNYYENTDDNNKYYGYYYKFGVKDLKGISTEESITVDKVIDFMDPSILNTPNIDNKHKIENVAILDQDVSLKDMTNKVQELTGLTYSSVYNITNWNKLYSTKHTDGGSYPTEATQDTATIIAEKQLSTKGEDLSVSNVAQVAELHITDNPKLSQKINVQKVFTTDNPTQDVYATVTPPTGKDRITSIIYGTASAFALVILCAGIIVIKKGFIDKK